ncbi:hypothetical protein, partial [Sinorhizobium meliloti]|uniref:hypothetical protein n=1 Tax=Rhizobium meliloti TaxID=382 RepID=UPI000FE118A0
RPSGRATPSLRDAPGDAPIQIDAVPKLIVAPHVRRDNQLGNRSRGEVFCWDRLCRTAAIDRVSSATKIRDLEIHTSSARRLMAVDVARQDVAEINTLSANLIASVVFTQFPEL